MIIAGLGLIKLKLALGRRGLAGWMLLTGVSGLPRKQELQPALTNLIELDLIASTLPAPPLRGWRRSIVAAIRRLHGRGLRRFVGHRLILGGLATPAIEVIHRIVGSLGSAIARLRHALARLVQFLFELPLLRFGQLGPNSLLIRARLGPAFFNGAHLLPLLGGESLA